MNEAYDLISARIRSHWCTLEVCSDYANKTCLLIRRIEIRGVDVTSRGYSTVSAGGKFK